MKKLFALMLVVVLAVGAMFAFAEPMLGGWTVSQNNEVTEEMKAVFDEATEKLLGVDYEAIAFLGSQVVAGTNYCFLCRATVVVPNAMPLLKLVYIYQDLEGNVSVTNIQDLDIAQFAAEAME